MRKSPNKGGETNLSYMRERNIKEQVGIEQRETSMIHFQTTGSLQIDYILLHPPKRSSGDLEEMYFVLTYTQISGLATKLVETALSKRQRDKQQSSFSSYFATAILHFAVFEIFPVLQWLLLHFVLTSFLLLARGGGPAMVQTQTEWNSRDRNEPGK